MWVTGGSDAMLVQVSRYRGRACGLARGDCDCCLLLRSNHFRNRRGSSLLTGSLLTVWGSHFPRKVVAMSKDLKIQSPIAIRFQHDLKINGKGERTQQSYVCILRKFAEFLGSEPDAACEQVLRRDFLHNCEHGSDRSQSEPRACATGGGAVIVLETTT
jgi:hypothetical protein